MAIYPVLNTESFEEKSIKPALKSSYDGGYTQRVAKYTRKISKFTFTHENLTSTQMQTLDAFFVANQGLSFSFLHPINDTTYEVSFEMDELTFAYDKSMKTYSTSIVLQEV